MGHNLRGRSIVGGKMAGTILATVALLFFMVFGGINSSFSQLPLSTGAPSVGQKLPEFTLLDQNGRPESLKDLLRPTRTEKVRGLVLIFYRGYW